MGKKLELKGKRFGRLVVLKKVNNNKHGHKTGTECSTGNLANKVC